MSDKKLGIVVIHGMGAPTEHYAHKMIRKINSHVSKKKKNPDTIGWKAIYWSPVTEEIQKKYLADAKKNNKLHFNRLREFIVRFLGDASAYQPLNDKGIYNGIHAHIQECIAAIYADLGKKDMPMIVLAHSLGTHIISCYIWDLMQKEKRNDPAVRDMSDFERFKTITRFITLGSTIPLFVFSQKLPIPITLPATCKWHNYYDPDDILGWPLKPINNLFDKAVYEDKALQVGGLLTGWNPLSHLQYRTDNTFTELVADMICEEL